MGTFSVINRSLGAPARALFVLCLFIGSNALCEELTDTTTLLRQSLSGSVGSDSFNAAVKEGEWVVTFCPDYSCDVIGAPSDTPEPKIGDFVFLYLYYASGSPHLKRFHLDDAPKYLPEVLSRNSGSCGALSEFALAVCVMNSLREQYHIRIGRVCRKPPAKSTTIDEWYGAFTVTDLESMSKYRTENW